MQTGACSNGEKRTIVTMFDFYCRTLEFFLLLLVMILKWLIFLALAWLNNTDDME